MLTVFGADENIKKKFKILHVILLRELFLTREQWFAFCSLYCSLLFSISLRCVVFFNLKPYKQSLSLFSAVFPPSPIFLTNPSPNASPCLKEFTWSQSSNSAHPSLYQAKQPLLHSSVSLSLHSLSHFPLLLLSNCQAALGPALHRRHRLLILLDHRKKHVCL